MGTIQGCIGVFVWGGTVPEKSVNSLKYDLKPKCARIAHFSTIFQNVDCFAAIVPHLSYKLPLICTRNVKFRLLLWLFENLSRNGLLPPPLGQYAYVRILSFKHYCKLKHVWVEWVNSCQLFTMEKMSNYCYVYFCMYKLPQEHS